MKQLNDLNGASDHTNRIVTNLMKEFNETLIGCEMGIAYGGGIENIGKIWKGRGFIYGFDTFEGHPLQISKECQYTIEAGGDGALATYCMQDWYNNWGIEGVTEPYIRNELDKEGLKNVILVKGLITEKTDISFIPKLHYVLLDLDFPLSMWNAYNVVKHKIVSGGYLCLHDVIPKGHIHGNYEYYQDMIKEGLFKVYEEHPENLLAILKKV